MSILKIKDKNGNWIPIPAIQSGPKVVQTLGNKKDAVMSQEATTREINYLKNYVTPQMFGAKGDGVTDDTMAIQQAIANYDNVYIPDGIYSISNSIVIESNNRFYQNNGYLGKTIKGDNAKFIITNDVPCIIVRGYHNKISNIVCCFSADVDKPTSALIELQGLSANAITQCCNNVIENVSCVSLANTYISKQYHGIGIKCVADEDNAIYQNKFLKCNCADLYKGIVIVDDTTVGINGNYFGVDLWNCAYLFYGGGNGNTFNGCYQSPWKIAGEDNVCFYVTGDYNTFHGFAWDVGSWEINDTGANKDNAPFLNVIGYGNVFTASCYANACKGKLNYNKINTFPTPTFNYTPYIMNTPLAMRGEGGYPVVYAPIGNSLKYNGISMTLETENVTMLQTPSELYSDLTDGIPTNIKPITNDSIDGRSLNFSCGKDAKLKIKIELPNYTHLEGLFIYTTNQRLIPNSITVRMSNEGFDDEGAREKIFTYDDNRIVFSQLGCFNLTWNNDSVVTEKYISAEIDLPTGNFGLSYISGVAINKVNGPLM